jgi:anaerobic selenocysteine-containing dehydrogenase
MLNPQKYGGLEYLPEIMIIHMSNTGLYPPVDKMREWLKMFMFIVAIDPWMSETASLFADIVLPAATIEKYEGPMDVTDGYVEGYALRIPPMAPLFKSRGEIEIYMDICERVGVLYGEGGYLDILNKELGLKDPYRLNLYRKPSVREIFDKWARSIGIEEGIEYFEKGNIYVRPIPVNRLYAPAWNPPYGGIRHRLYGESLKRYQDIMKEKSVPEPYYRDYTPFPTWREPTMNKSPTEYDLFLISYKKVEFKQSRSAFIPLLHELEPEQHLLINPATARVKEIGDGEEVWVESHNALTGETKKIKVKTKYIEGIRPDTVALSHHYGLWSHPWARKSGGPTPNELFFTGEGYVSMTADQSYHVKVKLYKGG